MQDTRSGSTLPHMATGDWAVPALQSQEDRLIYGRVEQAVATILRGHESGEFDISRHPALMVLIRIIYPAFAVHADGVLSGIRGSSLP